MRDITSLRHSSFKISILPISYVYGTLKDTGNIMAGIIAWYNGLSEESTLRATGSFNATNNKLLIAAINYIVHIASPPYYGEYPQSSIMQRYGWRLGNDIRK